MGVETLDFGFATPKRHFLSQELEKIAESLCAEGREITHAQNRNP